MAGIYTHETWKGFSHIEEILGPQVTAFGWRAALT
jgi:hypothetical protein